MISGDKVRQVAWYLPIDHCGEGFGPCRPDDGEQFRGCPYGWYEDLAPPVIEVVKDGVVVRTINALDLSEIAFVESADAAGGDGDE